MTLKKLSQLYYLKREIEMDKERLARMSESIRSDEERIRLMELDAGSPTVPGVDGMPKGSGKGKGLEDSVVRLLSLKEHIDRKKSLFLECMTALQEKQILCLAEQNKLERYIEELPDSFLRLVFTYRFVEGMTWTQVSEHIGMRTTEDSVKKACYRHLNEKRTKKC